MNTPDRLGELRAKMLPFIVHLLAEDSCAANNNAELNVRALQRFDGAVIAARIFHREHPEEEKDVHLGHLMQVASDGTGLPYLSCFPIAEFVLGEP